MDEEMFGTNYLTDYKLNNADLTDPYCQKSEAMLNDDDWLIGLLESTSNPLMTDAVADHSSTDYGQERSFDEVNSVSEQSSPLDLGSHSGFSSSTTVALCPLSSTSPSTRFCSVTDSSYMHEHHHHGNHHISPSHIFDAPLKCQQVIDTTEDKMSSSSFTNIFSRQNKSSSNLNKSMFNTEYMVNMSDSDMSVHNNTFQTLPITDFNSQSTQFSTNGSNEMLADSLSNWRINKSKSAFRQVSSGLRSSDLMSQPQNQIKFKGSQQVIQTPTEVADYTLYPLTPPESSDSSIGENMPGVDSSEHTDGVSFCSYKSIDDHDGIQGNSYNTYNSTTPRNTNDVKYFNSGSFTQYSNFSTNLMNQSGVIILTEEEKQLLIMEGYPVPSRAPMTKQDERNLKQIRRKIKNKISAQESRRKKKEYTEALEKKVEVYSYENMDLKRRMEGLESTNRSLLSQLRHMQHLLGRSDTSTPSMPGISRKRKAAKHLEMSHDPSSSLSTVRGTPLMVLILCFTMLFSGPEFPSLFHSTPLTSHLAASQMSLHGVSSLLTPSAADTKGSSLYHLGYAYPPRMPPGVLTSGDPVDQSSDMMAQLLLRPRMPLRWTNTDVSNEWEGNVKTNGCVSIQHHHCLGPQLKLPIIDSELGVSRLLYSPRDDDDYLDDLQPSFTLDPLRLWTFILGWSARSVSTEPDTTQSISLSLPCLTIQGDNNNTDHNMSQATVKLLPKLPSSYLVNNKLPLFSSNNSYTNLPPFSTIKSPACNGSVWNYLGIGNDTTQFQFVGLSC